MSDRFGQGLRYLVAAAALSVLPHATLAQLSLPPMERAEAPLRQVVLELYTAQGCASCPPADEMMAELAMREDVIALSLHVDYWDYIGWTDVFADPEHAERQKRYARRHGMTTIYTPQVVIDGTDILEGYRVMRIMDMLDAHSRRPAQVALDLSRAETGALEIRARVIADDNPVLASRALSIGPALAGLGQAPAPAPLQLQLVRYRPMAEVEILTGENAGRRGRYFNIVTSWNTIGQWDRTMPLEMSVQIEGSDPAVVILQEAGQGEITAAARLR